MIRFDLAKLVKRLETQQDRRITLKEIAEKSGCDKNALSRLVNHPEIIPSANVIDKLVQFFFFELKRDERISPKEFMSSLVQEMVQVFPDKEDYSNETIKTIKSNPRVSLSDVWNLHEMTTK